MSKGCCFGVVGWGLQAFDPGFVDGGVGSESSGLRMEGFVIRSKPCRCYRDTLSSTHPCLPATRIFSGTVLILIMFTMGASLASTPATHVNIDGN